MVIVVAPAFPRSSKYRAFSTLSIPFWAMLNAEDRAILDFERGWWLEAGPKDQAVEMTLGLTSSAYYDRLAGLVLQDAALAYDPLTVKRVRSLIEPRSESGLAV